MLHDESVCRDIVQFPATSSKRTDCSTTAVQLFFAWRKNESRRHGMPAGFIFPPRRKGGSRGSNEPPLEVNNGGLKTQTVQ